MFRPRVRLYFLAPMLFMSAILTGACGASHPEQQPLQQFFRASGMRDDQTLANFAVVTFDPKTDGQVTGFTIVNVSQPVVTPLKIKDLNKAVEDAQAADKEFNDRKKAYQDSHVDALKRVRSHAAIPPHAAPAAPPTTSIAARSHAPCTSAKASATRPRARATRPTLMSKTWRARSRAPARRSPRTTTSSQSSSTNSPPRWILLSASSVTLESPKALLITLRSRASSNASRRSADFAISVPVFV